MTIALTLPPELEIFVERSVKSGLFASEAELLLGALENYRTKEEFRLFQLEKMREKLAQGSDQLVRGETVEWNVDDFKLRARAHLAGESR